MTLQRAFAKVEQTTRAALIGGLGLMFSAGLSSGQTNVPSSAGSTAANPVVKSEFIYEQAPFPQCHASTLAETKTGLIAAWFGGKGEGKPDVAIWVSLHDGKSWSEPNEVVNGAQPDGTRYPCWNPVLFQPAKGPLLLFFKVGPSPSKWWGMLMTSPDDGATWSTPKKLPDGILGPIKNKPVQLPNGAILCGSSSEHAGWRVHMESTPDLGETWTKSDPLNDGKQYGAIQPSILFHPKNRLQILCRSRQRCITECWSDDGGKTWGPMQPTPLPNPNSGIDAVTLKDGWQLLVFNPTTSGRSPLSVAVAPEGKSWETIAVLETEPGEYSYPAVIQTRDGLVHITYTWKRQRVKHVVLNPNLRSP